MDKQLIEEHKVNCVKKQSGKKRGFTIVEILTIMSIIVILISLLVPALHKVRIFAKKVKQKNQFHAIEIGLDMFNAEFGDYPDSFKGDDPVMGHMCGAIHLCEAMVGMDGLGYSANKSDYFPSNPNDLEGSERYGPYIQLEQANIHDLGNLYETTSPFDVNTPVICDEFGKVVDRDTKKRTGMPVLYYKANAGEADIMDIYNYDDNKELLGLGIPYSDELHWWDEAHPEKDGIDLFYQHILNEKVKTGINIHRPYRVDSFILVSAGWDAKFGTGDDVFNFEKD